MKLEKLEKAIEYRLIFTEDEMKKFRKDVGDLVVCDDEFDDVYACIKDVRA